MPTTTGLPDAWQIQYFGSANNPAAAPNAMPAGDGVPNWMKYLLGLNPLMPGISVTNGLSVGVVWADGNSLNNPVWRDQYHPDLHGGRSGV